MLSWKYKKNLYGYGLLFLCLVITPLTAWSKKAPTGLKPEKYATLVVDMKTGSILHQQNAGKHRYPASLAKMMTLYLAFEAIDRGKLHMGRRLYTSRRAAAQPSMKLGLKRGEHITVRDAILSLVVRSANDSAVVLAEALGGSEKRFAKLMTKRARSLGMHHTVFRNASGLPNRGQKTTAYDLARLAIALKRDFPHYYPLFSRNQFSFKGKRYKGHNTVTKHYPGATGLKTGYIRASGYNLVTSASRNNVELVGIVLGGKSSKARDKYMVNLLDRYFNRYGNAPSRYYGTSHASHQEVSSQPRPITKPAKTVHVRKKPKKQKPHYHAVLSHRHFNKIHKRM